MADAPTGYTINFNFGKWADGANPGASAINHNWDLIDAAIKVNAITAGNPLAVLFGDKTWKIPTKADVGLNLVDNLKQEPFITAGTTTQYLRGDKTWQILNTDAVAEGATRKYLNWSNLAPLVKTIHPLSALADSTGVWLSLNYNNANLILVGNNLDTVQNIGAAADVQHKSLTVENLTVTNASYIVKTDIAGTTNLDFKVGSATNSADADFKILFGQTGDTYLKFNHLYGGSFSLTHNLSVNGDISISTGRLTVKDITANGNVDITGYLTVNGITSNQPVFFHSNLTVDGVITAQGYTAGNWNEAFDMRHVHTNWQTLDRITAAMVNLWENSVASSHVHANMAVLDGITATLVTNWNMAYTNNHTHLNKTVLDGITGAMLSAWDAASSSSHSHTNKAFLDVIDQALATTSNVTFANVTSGNILPSANISYNLGSSSYKWDGGYFYNLSLDNILTIGSSGKIVLGGHEISRLDATWLKINNSFIVAGYFEVSNQAHFNANIQIANKAGNSWLNFASRNISGNEAVYDLSNVGAIVAAGNLTIVGNIGINITNPTYGLHMVQRGIYIENYDRPYRAAGATGNLWYWGPNNDGNWQLTENSVGTPFSIAKTTGYMGLNTTPNARLHVFDSTARQAIFSGYTVAGATNRGGAGSIQLGENSLYAGRLDYNDAGQTVLCLDNTYDSATAKMQFRMRTSASAVEALTLLGSGKAGFGTNDPQQLLEIYGGNLQLSQASTGNPGLFSTINFVPTQYHSYSKVKIGIYDDMGGSYNRGSIAFMINNSGNTSEATFADTVMYISRTGCVNIGMTNSTEKLGVAGNFYQVGNFSLYNNFTSGILGTGHRLDYGVSLMGQSTLEIDNITVRNTLRSHIFEKDVVRSANSILIVSDSGLISSVDSASGRVGFDDSKSASFASGTQLWFKDWDAANGAINSVKFTINSIYSQSGGQIIYNVTVNLGSLSNLVSGSTASRISGGTLIMDASSLNGPYYDVALDGVTKSRFGNLAGIISTNWGALTGFGHYTNNFYAEGNAYISGTVIASAGTIGGWTLSATRISATNFIMNSGTTPYMMIGHAAGDSINLYYNSNSAWGFDGKVGNNTLLHLGSGTSYIAGWNFDNTKLSNNNVVLSSTGFIGLNGAASYGATGGFIEGTNGARFSFVGAQGKALWDSSCFDIQSGAGTSVLKTSATGVDISGTLTMQAAGIIQSANFVTDVSGYKLDGSTGIFEGYTAKLRGEFYPQMLIECGETLAIGDIVKVINSSGTARAKKLTGATTFNTTGNATHLFDTGQYADFLFMDDNLVARYGSNDGSIATGTLSGTAISFGTTAYVADMSSTFETIRLDKTRAVTLYASTNPGYYITEVIMATVSNGNFSYNYAKRLQVVNKLLTYYDFQPAGDSKFVVYGRYNDTSAGNDRNNIFLCSAASDGTLTLTATIPYTSYTDPASSGKITAFPTGNTLIAWQNGGGIRMYYYTVSGGNYVLAGTLDMSGYLRAIKPLNQNQALLIYSPGTTPDKLYIAVVTVVQSITVSNPVQLNAPTYTPVSPVGVDNTSLSVNDNMTFRVAYSATDQSSNNKSVMAYGKIANGNIVIYDGGALLYGTTGGRLRMRSNGRDFIYAYVNWEQTTVMIDDTFQRLGIMQEAGTVGQQKKIVFTGDISTAHTGLTPGERYGFTKTAPNVLTKVYDPDCYLGVAIGAGKLMMRNI